MNFDFSEDSFTQIKELTEAIPTSDSLQQKNHQSNSSQFNSDINPKHHQSIDLFQLKYSQSVGLLYLKNVAYQSISRVMESSSSSSSLKKETFTSQIYNNSASNPSKVLQNSQISQSYIEISSQKIPFNNSLITFDLRLKQEKQSDQHQQIYKKNENNQRDQLVQQNQTPKNDYSQSIYHPFNQSIDLTYLMNNSNQNLSLSSISNSIQSQTHKSYVSKFSGSLSNQYSSSIDQSQLDCQIQSNQLEQSNNFSNHLDSKSSFEINFPKVSTPTHFSIQRQGLKELSNKQEFHGQDQDSEQNVLEQSLYDAKLQSQLVRSKMKKKIEVNKDKLLKLEKQKIRLWQKKIQKIKFASQKQQVYHQSQQNEHIQGNRLQRVNQEKKLSHDVEKAFKKKMEIQAIQPISNTSPPTPYQKFKSKMRKKEEILTKKDSNSQVKIQNTAFIDSKTKEALKKILQDVITKPNLEDRIQKVIRTPSEGELVDLKIQYKNELTYELLNFQHLSISIPKLIRHYWKNIISLNLRNCGIRDKELKLLMINIYQFPDLERLDLGQNHISQKGASYIAKYINRCMYIKKLDLQNNNINAKAVSKLFCQKNAFKYLRNLTLSVNYMGDQGFDSFCKYSCNLLTIKKIRFHSNNLTVKSMISFNKFIDNFIYLKQIQFKRNKINDDGMDYLLLNLHRFQSLRLLILDSNQIGFQGFRKVVQKLKDLKQFQKLSLNENNIWQIKQDQLNFFDIMYSLNQVSLKFNPLGHNQESISVVINKYQLEIPKYKLIIDLPASLDLHDKPISIQILIKHSKMLNLNHVKNVDLSGCKLNDFDWNHLVSNIDEFYQVFTLNLNNNFIQNITHDHIQKLIEFLQFKDLKKKQLSNFKKKINDLKKQNAQKLMGKSFRPTIDQTQFKQQTQGKLTLQKKPKDQNSQQNKNTNQKQTFHFIQISLIHNKLSPASIQLIQSLNRQEIPIFFTIEQTKIQRIKKFRWDDFKFKTIKKIQKCIPSGKSLSPFNFNQSFSDFYVFLTILLQNIVKNHIDTVKVNEILEHAIKTRLKTDPIYQKVPNEQPNLLICMRQSILKLVQRWTKQRKQLKSGSIKEEDVRQLIILQQKMYQKFLNVKKKPKTKEQQEKERKKEQKNFLNSQMEHFELFIKLVSTQVK